MLVGDVTAGKVLARYSETNLDWTPDGICASCGCHANWHSLLSDRFVRPMSCNCMTIGCKCEGFVGKNDDSVPSCVQA